MIKTFEEFENGLNESTTVRVNLEKEFTKNGKLSSFMQKMADYINYDNGRPSDSFIKSHDSIFSKKNKEDGWYRQEIFKSIQKELTDYFDAHYKDYGDNKIEVLKAFDQHMEYENFHQFSQTFKSAKYYK